MKKIVIAVLMLIAYQSASAEDDLVNCKWENGSPIPIDTCNFLLQSKDSEAYQVKLKQEEEQIEQERKQDAERDKQVKKKRRAEWAKKSPDTQNAINKKLVSSVKRQIISGLKDPDSARFRNLKTYYGKFVCGEINAKNSYGGYIGFERFVGSESATVIHHEEISEEFYATWGRVCD